jgi:Big-like domain-containing protein
MRLIGNTSFLAFALAFVFTAVPVCAQQSEPIEAYFIFDCPPNTTFTIKLTDPQTIQEARNIIATGAPKMVIGTIVKQPVYYNSPWSYHLDPKSIGFAEFAVELCDANMNYLEANLDVAYSDWCPWSSRLVKEIPPPPKPVTENLAPTVSMRFPYADNTSASTAPFGFTLIANADDPDGAIVKVRFNSGIVIGETATYPYKFTWHPLAAGTYTVSATAFDNNGASTTSRSVTFVINPGPPQLLTDEVTSKAAALDSVTLLKEPFAVMPEHLLSSDQRTRMHLFGVNLGLHSDENLAAITVQAEDSQQRKYLLPVEALSSVPNFPWLFQVTVKLPDELQSIGDVWLSVSLRGVQSNKVPTKIR